MDNLEFVEKEVLELLRSNSEELKHAKNTLNWLLIINPNSDSILKISAIGHDIERVVCAKDEKKYNSHEDFKMAHSKRSAEIIKNILQKYKVNEKEIQRMQNIVLNHEFGGNSEANLIKDADSLANFQWVDDMWERIDKKSLEETMNRMFKRMEEKDKKFAKQVKFKHAEVKQMFNSIV